MRLKVLPLLCLVALNSNAHGGLTQQSLESVTVEPRAGARLPLETIWQDENGENVSLSRAIGGRPVVLMFADYTCTTLCGPVLGVVVDALSHSSLRASRDYRILVLALDAKDGIDDMRKMRHQQLADTPVSSAALLLRAGQATIQQATGAVGYHFTYDAKLDQFAHPAAVLILTADGHVSRVLSGLGLTTNDVSLALVEAGSGNVGSIGQRVQLLCYGFDPAVGVYTLSIWRVLTAASTLTAIMLAVYILALSLRSKRRT